MANPFNFGTPVPPNRMVGRWHQVESVTRDLVNLGGLSHMVIAGRRFGKSSFLEALRFSLVKQMNQKKSGNWYYIPVLVDLQSLTNFSPDGVFDLLLQCLYMCFNPSSAQRILGTYLPLNLTKTRLHTYVQNGQRGCPLYEFSEIIVDFQDVFLNKYGNLRPIYLLDEIEIVLNNSWTNSLFNNLRALISAGFLKDYIRYVIVGSSQVIDVKESGSPLLNMLNISYLEALKAEDILKIIHWAKGVPADVAYAVQEQSGGHPFIAQYLMYRIYEFGTSKTTRAVVTDLASRFMSERYADLAKWQLEIGEAGQRTYAVLAEADGWLTVDQVRKLVNTPKLNIQRWLDILCYHGLAVRDHQYNYRLTGELFKAWFKSNILTSLRGSHTNPESAYSLHASRSIKVFYLYAPEDEDLLVDLEKQLASMRRMGLITDWHSGKIGPGREISQEIEHHLNTCEIIVLLISPDFIASDNIYGVSQQALERHFAGTAHVVPVILRPVVWKWTLFEELKVLPANRKPITIWSNRDEAFVEVANGIRVIVEQLSSSI